MPFYLTGSNSAGTALAQVHNSDVDKVGLDIQGANTTEDVVQVTSDSLTTACLLLAASNSSDTSARSLFKIQQQHDSAVLAVPLRLEQAADESPCLIMKGPNPIGGVAGVSSMNSNGVTITPANLINGTFFAINRGSGKTDTTGTAADIVAAISGAAVGMQIRFAYINVSSNTVTLAGGTGVVMANTAGATFDIPAGQARIFVIALSVISGGSEACMMIPQSAAFSVSS